MFWYFQAWRKYCVFSGRARREEFWLFKLINNAIVGCAFQIAATISFFFPLHTTAGRNLILGLAVMALLFMVASLLPTLAVQARRLHDIERSAWYLLWLLLPLAGPVILGILSLFDSTPSNNRFGPNPKDNVLLTTP